MVETFDEFIKGFFLTGKRKFVGWEAVLTNSSKALR